MLSVPLNMYLLLLKLILINVYFPPTSHIFVNIIEIHYNTIYYKFTMVNVGNVSR